MGWLAMPSLAQAASPSIGSVLISHLGADQTIVVLIGTAIVNILGVSDLVVAAIGDLLQAVVVSFDHDLGEGESESDPDFPQRDTAYQLGFRADRRIVEWSEIGHHSCNVAVLAGALLKRQVSRCSEA